MTLDMKKERQTGQSIKQSKPLKASNRICVIVQNGFERNYHEGLTEEQAERLIKKHQGAAWIEGSEVENPTEDPLA